MNLYRAAPRGALRGSTPPPTPLCTALHYPLHTWCPLVHGLFERDALVVALVPRGVERACEQPIHVTHRVGVAVPKGQQYLWAQREKAGGGKGYPGLDRWPDQIRRVRLEA